MTAKFPFFDVSRQYKIFKEDAIARVLGLMEKQAFILGDAVSNLERDLAQWIESKHCLTISNGTEALTVSLRCLGVGPGDEVITTAFSFFASTGSILLVGAKPIFVDIDPKTYNIDVDLIEAAITPRTKCLLPVHLYGQCADMDPILEVAKKHRITVLEDFAQSIGARYKGRSAGTMGDLGATSFYPTKNLGGAGEGGAITTNSDELAVKCQQMRVHGSPKRYVHDTLGTNARMNAIQCAYLHAKLPFLNQWMERRNEVAQIYLSELRPLTDKGLVLPKVVEQQTHVWNQFVVRVPNREKVQKDLMTRGVPSEVYYPMTIPAQKVMRGHCNETGWPVAEQAAKEVLALPIFPELESSEIEMVIAGLRASLG